MIEYDDRAVEDAYAPDRLSRWIAYSIIAALAVMAWLILFGFAAAIALAQQQPSNCSGTATNTAAVIVFPTSGETGPRYPSQFLTIANPDAAATLWVCAAKDCTAAANAAGSISLSPVATAGQNGVSWWRGAFPPPARVSIISSAASSPFTCNYQ